MLIICLLIPIGSRNENPHSERCIFETSGVFHAPFNPTLSKPPKFFQLMTFYRMTENFWNKLAINGSSGGHSFEHFLFWTFKISEVTSRSPQWLTQVPKIPTSLVKDKGTKYILDIFRPYILRMKEKFPEKIMGLPVHKLWQWLTSRLSGRTRESERL